MSVGYYADTYVGRYLKSILTNYFGPNQYNEIIGKEINLVPKLPPVINMMVEMDFIGISYEVWVLLMPPEAYKGKFLARQRGASQKMS